MLIIAIVFFLGTGYTGYLLSTSHKRGTKPLDFLRTVHHSTALAGLACFGFYLFTGTEVNSTQLVVGFLLFLAAALGGFTLFRILYPQEQKPLMLIYAHASIAGIALVISIIGILN
jgi:hypothetical protein